MAKNQVIVSVTSNTKGLQSGLSSAQGALAKFGNVAATAAGAAAAIGIAVAGIAVAGGIARAVGLDEANTKFRALGYTAGDVTTIMDSALKSVKGTSFGLNQAATVAASALAAGVKPGKQLTDILTTVGNTAALAGSDFGAMGAIFNKVVTNTKVTTMEMNQLADRGVPAWKYLSESIGKTVPETRKMIEAGLVTSDMFLNAMGPAVEGVAATMGGSFLGSAKNALAAMSRFTAAFISPALPVLTAALAQFTDGVDALSALLAPTADQFGAFMASLIDASTGKIDFSAILDGLLGLREKLFDKAMELFPAILEAIVASIPSIIDGVVAMVLQLAGMLITLAPVLLNGAVTLFTSLLAAVTAVLPSLLAAVVELLPVLITSLLGMIPQLLDSAVLLFTALVDSLPVIIPLLISSIVELLPQLVETIVAMIPQLLESAIGLFKALVDALPVILPLLIVAILDLIPVLIETVISLVPQLLGAAISLFLALVLAIPEMIPALAKALQDLGPKIVDSLLKLIPQLVTAGGDLVGGLIDGLFKSGGGVVKALTNIAGNAIDGFKSFLGINSPSKLFAGFGGNLGDGLALGIDKSSRTVSKALDGMSSLVSDGFNATMSAPELSLAVGTGSAAAARAASRGNTYNISLSTLDATPAVGQVIVQAIKDYERAGGRQ
jgi:tape measure domain-containing protein